MKTKFFLFVALSLLGSHAALLGFALNGDTWTRNRTVVMHLSLPAWNTPLIDGFKNFGESAADALRIWNQYLAHMQFAVDQNSILIPSGTDADTSVFFSNKIYGETFGARALAVTLGLQRGHTMLEADVIFNSSVDFNSYRGPLQSTYDFHRIALHEFGHVLGLDHPNENHPETGYIAPIPPPTALMNATISSIDELQPDDIAGAQSIYANGPAYLAANPASSLVNLSTRSFVGIGDRVMIGGFIIQGSEPATIVLRAIGHSLNAAGIADSLTDPMIELHNSSGGLIAASDDWIDGPDATTIASYHLDPTNSRESALIATLNPGNYTAVVKAFDNGDGDLTGTGLVELYDLHTSSSRVANISTRGQVLAGDRLMIGGFIVGGLQNRTVIVRALGASLSDFGIANALNDPSIELRDATGNLVALNDNWRENPDAARIASEGFAPSRDAESALRLTLPPGSYTAIVRGANGTSGIALVEVYDVTSSN
ncbi:MAG: matrixin family metalloprotease [Chthoniobacterales bacterium]